MRPIGTSVPEGEFGLTEEGDLRVGPLEVYGQRPIRGQEGVIATPPCTATKVSYRL
jgi:hypothetical protein